MNIIKRFERMLKTANMESNQYYNLKRSDNSKWNDFLKQTINATVQLIKLFIDDVFTPILSTEEHKIYTPRFLDEIAEEIDVLENKKDSLFSRNRFKRILIPMLIVLKFFKLKLLIFLPIILGLVSFKKFLGFLAIVIPSVIGLLKLYKPVAQIYPPPIYLPSGVGFPLDHYKGSHGSIHDNGLLQYGSPDYLDQNKHISDNVNYGQKLAYQGYEDYQN
ncbi:PREDICTED: uncharacterized protein LOC105368407 [Ceratosolen solmsi marchali]|uniref:Uncharacterized protein LOC105368407 n=1 Tax=Ceratosolen solmsi marchali TaxID=326594 RepID=A0AAJ7E2R8_9HYME|nr:PREDICTED: uncharacterized protein LOC105368407 [Ceratosolen solmsi marchali]